MRMKTLRYTDAATADLLRHSSIAKRIHRTLQRYAAGGKADVVVMRDGSGKRMRIGDFRAIFEEADAEIVVTKIGPRGAVYDD
jgi:mRNA interferase RelE/StbE